MFFSPAILSLSMGLMALTTVLRFRHLQTVGGSIRILLLLLLCYAILPVTGLFRGDEHWLDELILKAPLWIVPSYLVAIRFNWARNELISAYLAGVTAVVALLSTVNYFMHQTEIDALLLQSKHVPVIGGVHHIYFGVFMAACIWLSVWMVRVGSLRSLWITLAGILFICMHILSSRTGLVALYLSGSILLFDVLRRLNKRMLIGAVAGLVLVPVLAFVASSSLQNKVANSIEDFTAFQTGEDINYKSFAMRAEAWKATTFVWFTHPFSGVGDGGFEPALQEAYTTMNTSLYPENRIGPHNQFLEAGAKYGWFGFILILLFFVMWFVSGRRSIYALTCLVLFGFVFLLESWLERQLGMMGVSLFLLGSILPQESID
ncbi:MAG: O-antigen ligase family protein [Flavobacteriales bacterium]|nr:O-antigen ligase family protein [Flavobacteriales bacterium]